MTSNVGLQLRMNDETDGLLKSFISAFLRDDFFQNIISVLLYPSDVTDINGNSSIEYMKKFFKDLHSISNNIRLSNINQIKKNIQLMTTILSIKENSVANISYRNVFTHLCNLDLVQQKLIADSTELLTSEEFKSTIDEIFKNIDTFYSIRSIIEHMLMFDNNRHDLDVGAKSPYGVLEDVRHNVVNLYNSMMNSNIFKQDNETDYYVISDENSVNNLSKDLARYILDDYSFYKTGYDIFDKYLEGIESGSVHMISAPSNAGKSLLMSNLAYNMTQMNQSEWKDGDTILIVTLEDDARKLTRRLISIFGNIDQNVMRSVYRRGYELSRMVSDNNKPKVFQTLHEIFNQLLVQSLLQITQKKVKIVIKHCRENIFSSNNLTKFIDRLKLEGLNVKLLFLDYIDVMAAAVKANSDNTYTVQGQITQELRNVSQNYKIPVITATQSRRETDDEKVEQNSSSIGDSWRKVTYSDFIYMVRMYHKDKTIRNADVSQDIYTSFDYVDEGRNYLNEDINILLEELQEEIIPFEIKITKSKEGNKHKLKYMIFSKRNLRFYDTVSQYLADRDDLNMRSARLNEELQKIIGLFLAGESLSEKQLIGFEEN